MIVNEKLCENVQISGPYLLPSPSHMFMLLCFFPFPRGIVKYIINEALNFNLCQCHLPFSSRIQICRLAKNESSLRAGPLKMESYQKHPNVFDFMFWYITLFCQRYCSSRDRVYTLLHTFLKF